MSDMEPDIPPGTPAPVHGKGKLLPGIAGIAVFLLVFTLMNVFGALANAFGTGRGKYGVLALCTMLVLGIFGLLRMLRWGWSMVLAGCILLSTGYFFLFTRTHALAPMLQGFFMLLFFLYLVRPEVRERMR